MEQLEQMEHTQTQIVMIENYWNSLEQNGTNAPFQTLLGTDGTLKVVCGTLNKLLFSLFRVFQMFQREYTSYKEKINIAKSSHTQFQTA